MPPSQQLAALHKHYVTADAVSFHLRRSLSCKCEAQFSEWHEAPRFAQLFSQWYALSVWYSLLYAVVEGYREFGFEDEEVDRLLEDGDKVDLLRRFRNATFHVQNDLLPEKTTDFMLAEDTEKWINQLNRAFDRFFQKYIDVAGWAERFRSEPE